MWISFKFPNDKGQKLVESGHLFNVEEVKSGTEQVFSVIKGFCVRPTSVSSEPWKVVLEVILNTVDT